MRRTTINSGFFICFIANLIVNWEWGFIAVLLWVLATGSIFRGIRRRLWLFCGS